jgi:hypothetical protein
VLVARHCAVAAVRKGRAGLESSGLADLAWRRIVSRVFWAAYWYALRLVGQRGVAQPHQQNSKFT